MGLVKFGAGVSQISGKVGGVVYSKNKGGSYVRNFKAPTNPNTTAQSTIRGYFAQLAARWSNVLTAAQRAAWALYAENIPVINRLGETIYMSALNMYIAANVLVLQAGGTIVDDGPTTLVSPQPDTTTPTVSEATQQISVAFDDTRDWCDEDGAYMLYYMSKPSSVGVVSNSSQFLLAGVIEGDSVAPPTTPTTIATPYAVTEGQNISVYNRIVRADGRFTTGKFRVLATVGA